MPEPQTPEWVRDAVFYQIFPDRFARSPSVAKPSGLADWGAPPTYRNYQGGDLVGVFERLDYLQDLGVNALYFTPIFQSACNHRYHTHDYSKVDPMLGGDAALRDLIEAAHHRGMRVVLDGVFNHCSRGFFQFHDVLENGADSAYRDWFSVHEWPLHPYGPGGDPGYACWGNNAALPKFNIRHPAVREFLWGVATRWIDFGIDGWRLDVANEIDDDEFWREFRRRVKSEDDQAYIVGEVWTDAARWLAGDMWDGVMNYQFTRACIAFFIGRDLDDEELRKTTLFPPGEPGAEAFARALDRVRRLYHPEITLSMLNLLDSHDMARFLTLARGDKSAIRLATLFQMTYPGAPSIYYGDEIGMAGRHDPDNRRAFPWNESTWDHELHADFKRLIALRKDHPSLRRGTYESLLASEDSHVHLRRYGEEAAVVALNVSKATKVLDVPTDLPDGTVLTDSRDARAILKVEGGSLRGLRLDPRDGNVFVGRVGA